MLQHTKLKEAEFLMIQPLHELQRRQFNRNFAKVTPKIIYFYYQKICVLDQNIQNNNNLVLKNFTDELVGQSFAKST